MSNNQQDETPIVLEDHTEPAATPKVEHSVTPAAPAAGETTPPPPEAEVVMAPVAHGRSFVLRNFFNSQVRIGQMLVFAHRHMRDAAIEVLETHFPVMAGNSTGKESNRYYLGDRKVPADYWPLIFEMKISILPGDKKDMEYRLLYPSGKTLRNWSKLDLGVLKLKTTEEQRALISMFTGIIYKLRETSKPPQKQTNNPERRPQGQRQSGPREHRPSGQRQMGGLFERGGVKVSEVKHKLKEGQHAPVRSDIQRGLPPAQSSEAVLPAGQNPDGPSAAEAAPTEPPATT